MRELNRPEFENLEFSTMFGWGKKDDGFEWHDYVRTTILIRRGKRREKLDEARLAAVRGVADAGKRSVDAGASGLNALGRGIWDGMHTGLRLILKWMWQSGTWLYRVIGRGWVNGSAAARKGADMAARHGGRAVKVGSEKLSVGAGEAWRAGIREGGKLRDAVADGATPYLRPELALPAGAIAFMAAGGGIGEFFAHGFSLLLFGLVVLALVAGAFAMACRGYPIWSTITDTIFDPLRRLFPRKLPGRGLKLGKILPVAGAACLAAVVVAGGYWWAGSEVHVSSGTSAVATTHASSVTGFAKSLSGDTLRIGDTVVKLSGVEAPELLQKCPRAKGQSWACGQSALQELRRITGYNRVTCELGKTISAGHSSGTCRIGEKDIAVELVLGGHVFAEQGFFSSYGGHESEAREQSVGIWRGDAVRPEAYRERIWKTAAQKAPNGCPVKGRVLSSRGKVYLMPWSRKYSRYKIRARRGERWFCSEQEALEAGWKPYQRL